jgi:hypothetical protein
VKAAKMRQHLLPLMRKHGLADRGDAGLETTVIGTHLSHITPGRTTLMDVHYWITAERKRQNFEFNFPASLDLQRFGDGRIDRAGLLGPRCRHVDVFDWPERYGVHPRTPIQGGE